MGNRRLPDAVHQRRGTLKPSRHGDPKTKLQLDAWIGEPPLELDDEGKREWFRVCAAMRESGVLTRVDRTVLMQYCDMYSDFVKHVAAREPWPPANHAQLRIMCDTLGFTPASRSKIVVPQPPKQTGGFADL